jgi:hypothetical protein
MHIRRIAHLQPAQRAALQALAEGAQLLYKWGRWEAYRELAGKTAPMGVVLTTQQMTELVDAVPAMALQPNPGPEQAFGFAWLPAKHRPDCADQLTLSMRTDHLKVPSGVRGAADWPIEFARPPERERMAA